MPEKNNTPALPNRPDGMAATETAGNFKAALSRLIVYSRRHLAVIIAAVILAILGAVTNIIGPGYLADITDKITAGLKGGIDLDGTVRLAVVLAVLYGVGFLLNLGQGIIMSDVAQRTSKRLRSDISAKLNRLPLNYFDRTSHGDTLSRVTNDVDTVGQSLTQSLSTVVTAVTMLIGTAIVMFYTNWVMTLAGVLATLLGFGLMLVIIRRSQRHFDRQQNELGILNGHIEEMYAGHTVVKAYNGEAQARRKFQEMNSKLYESAWKSQFYSGLMMPLMTFIGNLGYVAVCVTGAVLALSGQITFGTIVAFMVYIRLFTQPLSQLAQVVTSLQQAAAASERVFELLDEPELAAEGAKVAAPQAYQGNVTFDRVNFGYTPGQRIIHDFSATIKAGQKVAIVGPTGAGKTTLVNLLMRFYEVDGGRILIDGTDIASLRRADLHALFGMVLQDTWLFHGTVKENIIYAQTDVSDEQVTAACEAIGLHHFIQTLPDGYETILDENANISQGQRQLLTIARALVKDAPMLILDEATSSVDTRTEQIIQQAMNTLTHGRTSFVIAHRLSTIRDADLILVMRDGDIVESGTHSELLSRRGYYAALYNSQFETAA